METVTDFLFLGSRITADGDCSPEIRRRLLLGGKAMTNPESVLEAETLLSRQRATQSRLRSSQGHTRLWELDHNEGRAPKNWCLWTVVLEKLPESPWDSKDIKSVNLKGYQPWILIGRTDAEAETPILWPPDAKSWHPWCLERLRAGAGGNRWWNAWWHHQFNGHEFEQILGDGEGQVSLVCCYPWGCKDSNTT